MSRKHGYGSAEPDWSEPPLEPLAVMIGLVIALLIAAFAIGCTPTRPMIDDNEPIGPYHLKDPNT